jgi:hypothetical protein
MPDIELIPNTDPDDISQDTGAAAIGETPVTLTGAMTDYANRTLPPPNSLGLLTDGHEHPTGSGGVAPVGPLPTYSEIDATGERDNKQDPADGYAKAARYTKAAATSAHNAARFLIPAAEKGGPMATGLKTLNTIYSVPLSIGEGVARTFTDHRNGAPWDDAVVGNAARTGMVMSGVAATSEIPPLSAVVGIGLNKYLPDGAVMGHFINRNMNNPAITDPYGWY